MSAKSKKKKRHATIYTLIAQMIAQNPSPSCRLQLTRQDVFMMTFFVYFSCMPTVKHRL